MNLHPKEKKQKQVLAWQRELQELYRAERGIPLIKLEKPIRWGWKRFYVLRDDIAQRKDANVFRAILEQINTVAICRKKNFKVKDGKKLVDITQGLRTIPKDRWKFPEHYKKYFWLCPGCQTKRSGSIIEDRWGHCGAAYHFGPTFYFVTKIKPYYLTHVKQVDGDIESRKAELDRKMYLEGGWRTLAKMKGYRWQWEPGWDDVILQLEDKIAKKDLTKALEEWNHDV